MRVQNHKEVVLDGHIVAPAIGCAGDGEISGSFRVWRHNAAGVADGLRISALADAERKSIWRVAKFVGGFIGHAYAKDERVFGIEAKHFLNLHGVIGAIQNARLFFKIPIIHLCDGFGMVCLQKRIGFRLVQKREQARRRYRIGLHLCGIIRRIFKCDG